MDYNLIFQIEGKSIAPCIIFFLGILSSDRISTNGEVTADLTQQAYLCVVYLSRYGGGRRAITATEDKRYARARPRSIYINTSGDLQRIHRESVKERVAGGWIGPRANREKDEGCGGGRRSETYGQQLYVTYYLEYAHTSRAGHVFFFFFFFSENRLGGDRVRGSCPSLHVITFLLSFFLSF